MNLLLYQLLQFTRPCEDYQFFEGPVNTGSCSERLYFGSIIGRCLLWARIELEPESVNPCAES